MSVRAEIDSITNLVGGQRKRYQSTLLNRKQEKATASRI